jgi:hypothetical protein
MTTAIVSSVSLMGMIVLQDAIDEGARSWWNIAIANN